MTSDLAAAQDILRKTFGFPGFRPGQAEIVEAILGGRDVLAVMPTGSGKSLCYQLPALARGGLTVVVSPLIALMRNQVAQLRGYGVAAAALNSANDAFENRNVREDLARGELRLLYVAPERLLKPETLDLLRRAQVTMLAVDEAHCISQWGHDFRPEYAALGTVQEALGQSTSGHLQTVAFTATADAATRADILQKLFGEPPAVFVHGFDRPNLRLAMQAKAGGRKQILDFVKDHQGQSGIVYCASRRKTEEIAGYLREEGVKALHYHAGMEPDLRSRHQDVFLQEDGVVMAATIAFGMGIDKPDVRFILHADMPATIESYYQEIGRAGRDGLPADTLTLYGMGDIRLRRLQIDDGDAADEQKRVERQRLSALVSLCESPRCRRQTLLAYFGETTEPCGHCDVCCDGAELIDGTIAAQKAMSAILRTGSRFGTEHLTKILVGEPSEAIVKFGHDKLPTFGVGKEYGVQEWRSIFRQLNGAGVITLDVTGFGTWSVSEAGRRVLKGGDKITLRKDTLKSSRKSQKAARTTANAAALADGAAGDPELFEALRKRRSELAKEQRVAAYVVFADKTLIDMVRLKPRTVSEMAMVHGVGEAKLRQYGQVFLDAIRAYAAGSA
ncbi:MAG TPA: DNA helicase RecQ [Xanthobacteraceae bacterium]|nr:DNA helicase RecQ [Xanthobacteraceae bacterium]